jgi:lysophospholipase L1-like esterase
MNMTATNASTITRPRNPFVTIAAIAALLAGAVVLAGQRGPASGRWITAWATSQQALGTTPIANATVRMMARVTIAGEGVRIRLDNTYGTTPLAIGNASLGQRVRGAAIASGTSRPVTFNGSASVTVPAGGSVRSDPVSMKVIARQDLAVSLYVPEANVRPSQHNGALVTSYLSANNSGDVVADESGKPFAATTTSMFWLKAIDILSTSSAGSIIAFGDSITDGTCATIDAHDRWEDWVAVRLHLDDATRGGRGAYQAIVNEGIGGNTVTRENLEPPPDSTPGVERLERDVLTHEGVTDVVLFMGTNDIRRSASAAQVIAGMTDIARRVKARGAKIFGATIIPRHNVAGTGTNTGWNSAKTAVRQEVNQWIRSSSRAPFDGVLDFDSVVRDPANPDLIFPAFDCDGIHPTSRGYYEMGRSVKLELFRR